MELCCDLALGGLLERTAARCPDRPAICDRTRTRSYGQLNRETDEAAAGFQAMGIGHGTHVGLWTGNRAETLICIYALWKLGAVAVLLGGCRTECELKTRIAESDTAFLLYDHSHRGLDVPYLISRLSAPSAERQLCVDDLRPLLERGKAALTAAGRDWQVQPGDADSILFTSGSTDAPRGVLTTHFSRVNNALAQAELLRLEPEDRVLSTLNLFHCFSISGNALAALAAGACLVFPEDRQPRTLLRTVERERCTVLTGVPTQFSAMLELEDLEAYDLSSLRTGLIGGSLYPPELFQAICGRLHYDLLPSLGQTEATAGITGARPEDPPELKMHTLGRFLPHIEGCILDREGRALPPGEQGEICVRGYNVMQGYYKRPDLTAMVLDKNGWLHTGDMGYLDESGVLTMTGRCKELIIRGGENIAPGEVERIIAADARVAGVKVVGVPDRYYGEECCACVVLRAGQTLDGEEIRGRVGAVLAPFKVPRYVVFFNELPVTPSGKPDTAAIRRLALYEIGIEENKKEETT